MAFGDYADLYGAALRAAQMDTTTGSGDETQAKSTVNQAYLACASSGDPWQFLEKEGQWSTVAGTDKYTYSSIATAISLSGATIREIVSLQNDTDGYSLTSASWEHLESLTYSTQESGEGTGSPTMWSSWGSQGALTLRLYPNPDAVYTIGAFCYLAPSAMSDDSDTPLIPLAWRHRVIVPYAAALLLEQEGGSESGAQYDRLMRRYEDSFNAMRAALATARRPTFSAIQPGMYESRDAAFWSAEVW